MRRQTGPIQTSVGAKIGVVSEIVGLQSHKSEIRFMPQDHAFDRYLLSLRKTRVEEKTEHTDRSALEALLDATDASHHAQPIVAPGERRETAEDSINGGIICVVRIRL